MTRWLEPLVAALLAVVVVETYQYFNAPVAPDEVALPWTDPTRVPEAMARECREGGRQLIATKTDGPDWVYDCIEVNLPPTAAGQALGRKLGTRP